MANFLYQPIAVNEKLRAHIDDIYACLDDCLARLRVEDAFEEVSDAMCKEMDVLLERLRSLEVKYQSELPLEAEEPKGIEWVKECDEMTKYRQEFQTHSFSKNKESVVALMKRLGAARDYMERIDEKLFPEDNPDIYSNYSKRELMDYVMNRWNKSSRELRNQLASAPSTHQSDYFTEKLGDALEKIQNLPGYIISEDSTVIYYEALGRFLWMIRHDSESAYKMDDVLKLIKTAEYFSGRLQRKFIYLDRETSKDDELDEPNRLELLIQETLQNPLSKATMRLGFCKSFFARDCSEGFIGKMLFELIKSEHAAIVCDKMSDRKINKFIHQIAGVLKDAEIFVECSYGELADDIAFTKPRRDSRIDYIRHMIDDVPEIQTWIENYIKDYRQKFSLHYS